MKTETCVLASLLCASLLSVGATAAAPDRSKPPEAGAPKPFTIEQPKVFTLKSGLTVWHVARKRAPLVDVLAVIDAGPLRDPADRPGVAKWTADLLTEGSGGMRAVDFSDAVQSLGAEVASTAEIDHAWLSLHVTSARFPAALKLYAQALLKPDFADAEWARIRGQLFGEMMYQSQEPQELAQLAAQRANWGAEHRLGTAIGGTPRALIKTTPADLKAFYAAHYRPDATTLVVVGDIEQGALKRLLEAELGAWTASGSPPAAPALRGPPARNSRALYTVQVPEAPQTVLRVGIPAPAGTLPFTPDADVMNTLLGASFTSRLNTNLRETHGYSYGAHSRVAASKSGALFSVMTSVNAPTTAPALAEIFLELDRIRTPATEEEAVRARNVAALTVPSAFDSGRATASQWALFAAQRLDRTRLQQFVDQAQQVDVKALQGAALRLVRPSEAAVIAVGDLAQHGKGIAGLDKAIVLTVDDLLPGLAEAGAALGGDG
ncbi:MAG: insulinase family protein [Deltaproteobacteria bacterium]|nr:insulinase family protein [Deltaproteobacteria bacterium]